MKKTAFLFLLVAGLGVIPAAAKAPYHYTRVSWIVATRDELDDDDRYVTIIGHVTRRIGDEHYWFTDGTGSVRLDSENFDLPIGARIVVGGRIDQAWMDIGHLEVDVRRWHYAPRVVVKKTSPTVVARRSHAAPSTTAVAPAPSAPPAVDAAPATTTMTPASSPATNALTPPTETNAPPQTTK